MAFIIENTVLIGYIDEKGVQDITIPDGVTKIESDIFNEQGYNYIHVFEKCKNVRSITIPESVTEIDPNEFYYLKNLEWIECRGEVSVKYDCVFPGCKKLAYIICNPNTPLQELPEKWKLQLSIGVTKYISDGHAVSEEARKAVTKYISSQNKKKELYNDPVAGLQPGDDITFTVTLESANKEKADWYMTNEVLHSLEDRSKSGSSGGAYSYKLVYNGPGGERILYDSDTDGGDDVSAAGVGLHEATSALKDYFYLDTLTTGQTGKVTLNVALDGESQGNRYQDTLADLQMNFAVESRAAIVRTGAARTGDASHLLLIWLVVIGGGIGALVLAVLDVRDRRRERRAVK